MVDASVDEEQLVEISNRLWEISDELDAIAAGVTKGVLHKKVVMV